MKKSSTHLTNVEIACNNYIKAIEKEFGFKGEIEKDEWNFNWTNISFRTSDKRKVLLTSFIVDPIRGTFYPDIGVGHMPNFNNLNVCKDIYKECFKGIGFN